MHLSASQLKKLHRSVLDTFNTGSLVMFTGLNKDDLSKKFADVQGNDFEVNVYTYLDSLNRISKAKAFFDLCWEEKTGYKNNPAAQLLHKSLEQESTQQATQKLQFLNTDEVDNVVLGRIKKRIGDAQTKRALQELQTLPVYDIDWKNTLTQLEASFNKTEREKRRGIIDSKEHRLEISKVVHGLLELINELNEQIGTN